MRLPKISFVFGFILFHISFVALPQSSFYGRVADQKTKEPVPFVNIGFVKQAIGTTSDEVGEFFLEFRREKLPSDAVIQISSLGYVTKTLSLEEANQFFNNQPTIYLAPTDVKLDEVVLYNDGQEFISDKIGYANFDENHFGYWKGSKALGAELATRIHAREGVRKLHKLKFLVVQPPADSLLLRINIYDDDGGVARYPGTNLNKSEKNIFCKVYSDSRIIEVDLNPFEIVAEDDFIVSLELVKYYVKGSPEFALAASYEGFGSYKRYASQDKWSRFSNLNMAYQLETSLLVSKKIADRFEKSHTKKQKRQRTVSGFALNKGRMIAGVEVTNFRTKESVFTDAKGRYVIAAKKRDKLYFQKEGYQIMALSVGSKPTANIIMKQSD